MNTPKDGGPAFPQWDGHAITSEPRYLRGGMSLRDFFAAMALQSYLSASPMNPGHIVHCSELSYQAADAMLAERNKPNE